MASTAAPMAIDAAPSKTPMIIGIVVFLLILVAAYFYMSKPSVDASAQVSAMPPPPVMAPPPPPPTTTQAPAAAPAASTAGYVGPFNGFDYPGNDLGNWSNADPAFCASKCSQTTGCVGYIVSTTGQGCYAKSKFENPQASPTSNTYTKPGTVIPNSSAKYQTPIAGHYTGNELATFTNNDPNYCASQCDANASCVAFETNATDCRTKAQLTNPLDSTQTSVKVYAKQGVQASNATTQPGGSLGALTPNYGLPGLTAVPFATMQLKQFYIKNATTGKWLFAGTDGKIAEVDTSATLFKLDKPTDLYSQTGDGNLVRIDTGSGYVRHLGGSVLFSQPYTPGDIAFAWEFFTNGPSTGQMFLWNPYIGDTLGSWLQSATDGSGRPRIVPKATIAQAYVLVPPGTAGIPSGVTAGTLMGYNGPQGGVDYPGNDIARLSIGDAAVCSQKCDSVAGCVGFVMAADSQNCWLKSSFGQSQASSVRPTYTRSDTLSNNQALGPGQSITSRSGHWMFTYQTDANIVLYDTRTKGAKWAMQTVNGPYGYPPGKLIMQSDGNFVAYDSSGGAKWASGTYGKGQAPFRLVVQDDGNVVVYDANGAPTWATNTWQWPWAQ